MDHVSTLMQEASRLIDLADRLKLPRRTLPATAHAWARVSDLAENLHEAMTRRYDVDTQEVQDCADQLHDAIIDYRHELAMDPSHPTTREGYESGDENEPVQFL